METRESCIFFMDWLYGIEPIEDPIARDKLFRAITRYSLFGEEPELSKELQPIFSMMKVQADRANNKREHIVEVRRAAIQRRWAKQKDTKNTNDTNVQCVLQDDTKNTNVDFEYNSVSVSDSVSDSVSVSVDSSSPSSTTNKNLINLNTPLPPQGGVGGGKKGFVIYFQRVEDALNRVPPRVKKCNYTGQYAWRIAEGMPAFAKAVDGLILSEKEDCYFELAFGKLLEKYKPQAEWQAFQVAEAAMGLDAHAVEALCAEIDRSRAQGEEGLWATMLDKIAYMKENEVKVPEAFLKKREHPVKYTKQQRKT